MLAPRFQLAATVISQTEILIIGGRDASTYFKKAIVFDIESQACQEIIQQPVPVPAKPEEETKVAKEGKTVTWDVDYATEPS